MKLSRVTAPGLNLRNAAGTGATALRVLPQGTEVEVLAASTNNRWALVRARDGQQPAVGWVAASHLARLPDTPATGERTPWGRKMRELVGLREIPGPRHHPWIVDAHARTSFPGRTDEASWCSSALNKVMEEAGIPGTGSAAARSWLRWGRRLTTPVPECVVILDRSDPQNPQAAHVALFLRAERRQDVAGMILLGGNQSNSVCERWYPASRVLGYRWPADYPLPGEDADRVVPAGPAVRDVDPG